MRLVYLTFDLKSRDKRIIIVHIFVPHIDMHILCKFEGLVCSSCQICAELKPKFHRMQEETLINATKVFERISIDFKGPLPSSSNNKYILMVIDEYSCFPFAFPCPSMHSSTVITCLNQLFLCAVCLTSFIPIKESHSCQKN